MFASGVRRSWLAQATSSRRTSKSCSRFAAISLKDAAISETSTGPDSGARTVRSPRDRDTDASRTWSIEPAIDRARKSPPIIATVAEAADIARILTSSPMWNMTQPERNTEASGRQTASAARPMSCRRTVGSDRKASARTSPTPSVTSETTTAPQIMRSRHQSVADAPDRLEMERLGGVGLDLLAQAPDVNRHRSGVECCLVAPDAAHQLISREDALRIPRKKGEKVELLRSHPELAAAFAHFSRGGIDLDVAEGVARRTAVRRRGTPQHRPHPCGELAGRERLRHVVVGAEIEPDDPVRLLPPRRQQDHGKRRAASNPAAELEAVDSREHHVQHDQVYGLLLQHRSRRRAVVGLERRMPFPLQVAHDHFADDRLVVDYEDGGHRRIMWSQWLRRDEFKSAVRRKWQWAERAEARPPTAIREYSPSRRPIRRRPPECSAGFRHR